MTRYQIRNRMALVGISFLTSVVFLSCGADITVTTPTSSTLTPTITSISPTTGSVVGNTSLTITGTNYTTTGTGPTVSLTTSAGVAVSCPVTTASTTSTNIICTVPAHATGAVTVTVTNPDGTAS